MNALGRHFLLDLKDCNREVLNDLTYLQNALCSAAKNAGATVLGESFHRFSPQGVSGVVIIAESHFSLHTWPEHGYAAVDIFTCGDSVKPELAVDILTETLESKSPSFMEIKRGLLPE